MEKLDFFPLFFTDPTTTTSDMQEQRKEFVKLQATLLKKILRKIKSLVYNRIEKLQKIYKLIS